MFVSYLFERAAALFGVFIVSVTTMRLLCRQNETQTQREQHVKGNWAAVHGTLHSMLVTACKDKDATCAVCLDSPGGAMPVRILLCLHQFHAD